MANTDEPFIQPTASIVPTPSTDVVKEMIDMPKPSSEVIRASEGEGTPPPSIDYEKKSL
tara:strand:- start:289 stop:465 length:177 start_codon:yes stop_codon:yes gene_type:complete